MKAAYLTTTGEPGVIQFGDVPDPSPGPNQILVQVSRVAVNPIDVYIRSGSVRLDLPNPYIIGCDFAGTVVAVGPQVTRFQVGDRVWGSNQGLSGRQGTFSELIAVDEDWAYPIPDNVADEQAVALALVGITAHLGLYLHGGLKPGETVFVNGGTGGVGSAVVQIAKAGGATVVTTVGTAQKQELARQLGADVVLNYRTENLAERLPEVIAETGPFNLWFETLRTPDPAHTFPLLARRGRYILMAGRDARPEFPVGPFYVNDLRAIGFAMFNASADEQRQAAEQLNTLMAEGRLKAVIGARFPLTQAAAAHQLQEENTLHGKGTLTGKIVLNV